jgi:Protein of unknown function (DUF3179)
MIARPGRPARGIGRAIACAIGLLLGHGANAAAGGTAARGELPWAELTQILSATADERRAAAESLVERQDPALLAPLVDAYFFTARGDRAEIQATLEALTGERFTSYKAWVEYLGRHEEIRPAAGYVRWKVALLAKIDRHYHQILYGSVRSKVRIEELMWGGVPVDGIPSLDSPPTIPAARATYLAGDERVFGVALGDRARAYPLRFLDWHEMVNDELAGQPYALSYCTLCGSGILYATDRLGGRRELGTSGLLYRSNKLMYDRESFTLWSNLTGEPVLGRRVDDQPLRMLPMTLTTWDAWRGMHPRTDVLDLTALRAGPGRRFGFDYTPGAARGARAGVSFPVWQQSDRLAREAEIYALRVDGVPKAYALDALLEHRVLNDRVGRTNIVLVVEWGSGAVRAYERGELELAADPQAGALVDSTGAVWRVGEAALVSDAGRSLARLPGHVAFWFGWYGFYPQTEVYTGAAS